MATKKERAQEYVPQYLRFPISEVRCFLDEGSSYGDGLPHLVSEIRTRMIIDDRPVDVLIDLHLATDSDPSMTINAQDPQGRTWAIEDLPGDAKTINALIALLSETRDTIERETPRIAAKVKKFDQIVGEHRDKLGRQAVKKPATSA